MQNVAPGRTRQTEDEPASRASSAGLQQWRRQLPTHSTGQGMYSVSAGVGTCPATPRLSAPQGTPTTPLLIH